ncbi:LIM/homeobox protein ceh-14-like, partial [Sorex araneus]|uniref:LIM/homeobox protein ceh-14-like n=1 Tax=Sorex araneus TaxID=42254 RepID=UPI0024338172
ARKPRTRFSPAELRALREAFQKNMSPGRAAVQSLASETGLDTYVVQNIVEFTRMYLSPGDDDFSKLDQYLF